MRALKSSFLGSMYYTFVLTYVLVSSFELTILCLVLDIEQLSVHDVQLCVTDAEDVASNIS